MFNEPEIPKHKKKKSQTSKSCKRSNHKHDYERVIIVGNVFGAHWSNKCKICGRIKSMSAGSMSAGLLKPRPYQHISISDYLTPEEAHAKYPDIPIYERTKDERGYTMFGDNDMKQITFDENI